MSANLLRVVYMFEFLLALIATLQLWSQVGGQGHLDLMPWHTKLGLTLGMALVTVMGTAAAVSHQQAWNAKTIACLVIALMLAAGMAGVTYYYHLHENQDDEDQDDSVSATFLTLPASYPVHGARSPRP